MPAPTTRAASRVADATIKEVGHARDRTRPKSPAQIANRSATVSKRAPRLVTAPNRLAAKPSAASVIALVTNTAVAARSWFARKSATAPTDPTTRNPVSMFGMLCVTGLNRFSPNCPRSDARGLRIVRQSLVPTNHLIHPGLGGGFHSLRKDGRLVSRNTAAGFGYQAESVGSCTNATHPARDTRCAPCLPSSNGTQMARNLDVGL